MRQQETDSLFIRIHSIVNTITNSSSELFIVAREESITTIKELINTLLKINEGDPYSTKTADDLFEFSLEKEIPWAEYDYYSEEEKNDLPYNMYIKVKPKLNYLEYAAKILSNLTDLFYIHEECSG